jgi:hypothetical protein
MSYRTVKGSMPPAFPVAWQLSIPVEEQAEIDDREALTRDIADSPAFSHIVQHLAQAKALGFDPQEAQHHPAGSPGRQ